MPRPLDPPHLASQSLPRCLYLVPLCAVLAFAACGPAGEGERAGEERAAPAGAEGEARGDAGPVEAELWLDDVRIGHQVDPEGAIPVAQRADQFAPGERVYVSMAVADAPPFTAVHVVFANAAGETVAEDEKKVPAGARHLYFDSGDTTHWLPGPYRVVVAVDGEPTTEKEFTLTDQALERNGEPG